MSMNENGFIIINKALNQTKICNNLESLGLLLHLCLNSTYKDSEMFLNGQDVEVKKGTCVYSQLNLSNHFGVSLAKINRIIKRLEKNGIVKNKNTNKYSLTELKNDFICSDSEKQMKNKGITNENNNNKYINKEKYKKESFFIEDLYFKLTGKKEVLEERYFDDDMTFDNFKKSFENYLEIVNSKFTFYNYKFGSLNDFLKSKKGFAQFLTANISDYLDTRRREDFEYEKTKMKRDSIINAQKKIEEEMTDTQKMSIAWLSEIRQSKRYIDKMDEIREIVLKKHKNATFSNSVFLAYESIELKKFFNCPF